MTGVRWIAAFVLLVGVPLSAQVRPPAESAPADDPPPSSPLPHVFQSLLGQWEGTGELLGRPGFFEMRWTEDGGPFVSLAFRNGWVDESGSRTPALSARAVYQIESRVGVWVDDRPKRIRIDFVVDDSTVVSEWTAEAEAGRTEYTLRSSDSVVVRDWVYVEGEARLFGEATYRRRAPVSPRRPSSSPSTSSWPPSPPASSPPPPATTP